MRSIRVLTVANQKGGVAKTTTAVQVAGYLAAAGQRVLLIDLDPQGNATLAAGKGPKDFDEGILGLFQNQDANLPDFVVQAWPNLDLLPCDIRLSVLELQQALEGKSIPLDLLKRKLPAVADRYHYVLIDTPPSLGAFTLNALGASDRVLIPIDGGNPFAVVGLKLLLNTIRDAQRQFNPKLRPLGYFRAKWDDRTNLAKQMWSVLLEEYPNMALQTAIPENIKLPQAMASGEHIMGFDERASGAAAYLRLTEEILDRWEGARW